MPCVQKLVKIKWYVRICEALFIHYWCKTLFEIAIVYVDICFKDKQMWLGVNDLIKVTIKQKDGNFKMWLYSLEKEYKYIFKNACHLASIGPTTFKPSSVLTSLFSSVLQSLTCIFLLPFLFGYHHSFLRTTLMLFLSKEWPGSSPSCYLQCLSGFLS